jgi:hypothetical protein
MAQPAKSVLWVDDEAELLEPHRMFFWDKGFDVGMATNADVAVAARFAVRPSPAASSNAFAASRRNPPATSAGARDRPFPRAHPVGSGSREGERDGPARVSPGTVQWRALEQTIAPKFDIETTHDDSLLPTATPYSRNALFSGKFPGEIAARFPDWWGEREEETLKAHERDLLGAQLEELGIKVHVRNEQLSTAAEGDDFERRRARATAPEGISAFVSVLREAARRHARVLIARDHGSIHCRTPATVYPTTLREYQSRSRGSFLHGGVTPEECVLPVSLLTPRR